MRCENTANIDLEFVI